MSDCGKLCDTHYAVGAELRRNVFPDTGQFFPAVVSFGCADGAVFVEDRGQKNGTYADK